MITIEDFGRLDLRIAQIKEVKEHPNADRLYILKIETGEGERQLVAGIRKSYTPEELIGKKIVFISNLEPATIRGEQSHGMLLAASDENGVSILTPQKDVAVGSKVK